MSLSRGLELIRAGAYFDAHEELEDEWREAPSEERDFLQGLVHVAVAWLHAERSNRPGCERQLEKAARRLVHVPMGRFAEAREIAQAALFLASDESSYVNATAFMVDGGLSGAYITPE